MAANESSPARVSLSVVKVKSPASVPTTVHWYVRPAVFSGSLAVKVASRAVVVLFHGERVVVRGDAAVLAKRDVRRLVHVEDVDGHGVGGLVIVRDGRVVVGAQLDVVDRLPFEVGEHRCS